MAFLTFVEARLGWPLHLCPYISNELLLSEMSQVPQESTLSHRSLRHLRPLSHLRCLRHLRQKQFVG